MAPVLDVVNKTVEEWKESWKLSSTKELPPTDLLVWATSLNDYSNIVVEYIVKMLVGELRYSSTVALLRHVEFEIMGR